MNHRLTLRHKSWNGPLRQSSLQITYSDGKGRESNRRVDAWGIFRSDGRYFMVGYCHLRKGRRVFAIHRIIKADLLSSAVDASFRQRAGTEI